MNFDKIKKRLNNISQIIGQAVKVSKQFALGAGIATIATGATAAAGTNQPQLTLDPKVAAERRTLSKLSGKYLLKRAITNDMSFGHASHSSHSSHSSHYSSSSSGHASHASHYSSTAPYNPPPTALSAPSHYSGASVTPPEQPKTRVRVIEGVITPVYTPNDSTNPASTTVIVPPAYSSNIVFSENFNGLNESSEKWTIGSLIAGAKFTDKEIGVSVTGGQFKVAPRTGLENRSYSGLISKNTWDMTAAHARVEVPQITNGTPNTIFAMGLDNDNWYGFVTESDKLFLQIKIGGKKNSTQLPYSKIKHRFWRLRHEVIDGEILWETSADGENWTIVRKLVVDLDLTKMYIYLGAGTYLSETAPGTAIFDNFKLVVHKER